MAPKPFLFDAAFDGDIDGQRRRPPPKKFDEAAVEAERKVAYAKGVADGEARGFEAGEAAANARANDVRGVIANAVGEAFAAAEAAEAAIIWAAPAAAAQALSTAFPAFAAAHGHTEILAVAREALVRAADEPRLVVRLAAEDFETIEPELADIADKSGFPGRIVTLEDAEVRQGDARIEWADGGLSRDLARTAAAISDALNELAADPVEAGVSLAESADETAEPQHAEGA